MALPPNNWMTGRAGQNFAPTGHQLQQTQLQTMRAPSTPLDYNRLTQGVRADPAAMEEAANMAFRSGLGPEMPTNQGMEFGPRRRQTEEAAPEQTNKWAVLDPKAASRALLENYGGGASWGKRAASGAADLATAGMYTPVAATVKGWLK